MIEVKLHNPIASADNGWMYSLDGSEGVFSLEFVQGLFAEHPEEQDFKFNIHCPGGEVEEGLAIYDALRTSGKNIYMNIEGACHSMAVTLLLAAPYENRTANPNCRALIHKVWTCASCGTADELEDAAEQVRSLQNSILDIYADRTNVEREELARIMDEEKFRTADDLLRWGFVSKINPYNTNLIKNRTMNIIEKIQNFIDGLKDEVKDAVNYVFYGEDGEYLFETDAEDDRLEAGLGARPDGEFDLGDKVVVVSDGKIEEVREKEEEADEAAEEMNALREENAALREQLTEAQTVAENAAKELEEAKNLLAEAKRQIVSNGKIGNRIGSDVNSNKGKAEPANSAERKAAIKERLKK